MYLRLRILIWRYEMIWKNPIVSLSHFCFRSVLEAPQRNPLMVITPEHSQPILSTALRGIFHSYRGCGRLSFRDSSKDLLQMLLSMKL